MLKTVWYFDNLHDPQKVFDLNPKVLTNTDLTKTKMRPYVLILIYNAINNCHESNKREMISHSSLIPSYVLA